MTLNAHPAHVAILDDDVSIRNALGRLLRVEGMIVGSYATSDQFFTALAMKHPDCLVLDLHMTEMGGLDVLKHLGQLEAGVPTIIFTAHDDTGFREICLKAGAVEYLLKPMDAGRLIQTIKRILT